MSASRLTWLVALCGAVWTWLLASWSGVSLATSLFRAVTVFVMLTAVFIVFQVIFASTRSTPKPSEDRPTAQEMPSPPDSQQEDAQNKQAA